MPVMIRLTSVKFKDIIRYGLFKTRTQEDSENEMWINASRIIAMVSVGEYTRVTMKEDRTDFFIVKESPEQIRQMIREEYKKMVE